MFGYSTRKVLTHVKLEAAIKRYRFIFYEGVLVAARMFLARAGSRARQLAGEWWEGEPTSVPIAALRGMPAKPSRPDDDRYGELRQEKERKQVKRIGLVTDLEEL